MNNYDDYNRDYGRPRHIRCGSVVLGTLAILVVLVIAAFGTWKYLEYQNPDVAEHTGSQAMMPYVVNTQSEVARALLEDEGFVVTGYDFHKSYRREEWGMVKEQPLEAGKYYPRGTKVKLVVWGEEDSTTTTTKAQVAIPNLVGQYYGGDFNSAKYPDIVFRFRKVPGNESKGTIIRQNISPGTMVPEGTDLYVYYSGGPDSVVIPDLVGWSKDDAVEELESLGLNVEVIEDDNDGSHESGEVNLVETLNGRTFEKGETVTIYVWK